MFWSLLKAHFSFFMEAGPGMREVLPPVLSWLPGREAHRPPAPATPRCTPLRGPTGIQARAALGANDSGHLLVGR